MPSPPDIPRATGWRLHTPNALVILRLAVAAIVFWLIATWSRSEHTAHPDPVLLTAAGLFVFAALTDAADGMLARKWNAITKFGRVMDPFADKILVLGAMVLLAGPAFHDPAAGRMLAGFQGWMVILILARELLVTSLRGLAEGSGVDASANWAGKAKMIVQSVAVPAILLLIAFDPPNSQRLASALAWLTTGITTISAWPYIRRALPARDQHA